jgi:hypothetical protein
LQRLERSVGRDGAPFLAPIIFLGASLFIGALSFRTLLLLLNGKLFPRGVCDEAAVADAEGV